LGLGRYPRGIAIDAKSRYAYVSVMGDDKIAIVKLSDYSVQWIEGVGKTPRHLCLGPSGRYLYVSLSREGKVAKIDLTKREVVSTATTGREARSMVLTPEGNYLYVVNYLDNSLSKVRTRDMKRIETENTRAKPIGVTLDASRRRVWVACYTGSLMVFEDKAYVPQTLLPEVPLTEAGPLPPMKRRSSSPSLFSPFTPASAGSPPPDPNYYVYRPVLPIAAPPKEAAPLATREKPATPSPPAPVEKPEKKPVSLANEAPPERPLNARVRAIPPREDSPPVANRPTQAFYLIAGSYQDRANALQRQKALVALGFEAQVLASSQGWYRVSIQSHPTRLLAETAQRLLLQNQNIDAWIYQP
jgi:cell division protein FtsN